MDSLINAAARALAIGDPLGALKRVALREDPPALAVRGIAMAQLGDLARAKDLLKRAIAGFGHREPLARARCWVAQAEIALAARDLRWPPHSLETARRVLLAHGDRQNATHAQFLQVRRLLLLGRTAEAERILGSLDAIALPPGARAAYELIVAGIALRQIKIQTAKVALGRAAVAARLAAIPALSMEVERATHELAAPAARHIRRDGVRLLRLEDVEALLASDSLVIDACRCLVRDKDMVVSLSTRPVLFKIVGALARAWPEDAPREELIRLAFRSTHADDSYRARLRVEIGRLRLTLRPFATVSATQKGFLIVPRGSKHVVLLAPPIDEPHAAVLAFLSDGQSWSSSALAVALNASQRTVQRALDELVNAGKVQPTGQGRSRRWMSNTMPGFTTVLLLPMAVPVN